MLLNKDGTNISPPTRRDSFVSMQQKQTLNWHIVIHFSKRITFIYIPVNHEHIEEYVRYM
jgi:hypothetical protein